LNNILSNLFIFQKNVKGSNTSNCMVVQLQILFILEINRQLYRVGLREGEMGAISPGPPLQGGPP